MPDHFHGLLQPGTAQTLPQCVQRLKSQATRRCRNTRGERIELWARGYYDHALRHHDDVKTVARYIVANPLRAKLVDNLMAYPYWNAKWL